MSTVSKEQFIEFLDKLTLKEAAELVKELEERYGVSASAPVIMAGAAAPAAAAVEEKDEFNVILVSAPADKKVSVIKEVRAITGLGLKEAKDLVEGAPKEVKAGVNKEEAAKIKKVLEDAGAKVDVK